MYHKLLSYFRPKLTFCLQTNILSTNTLFLSNQLINPFRRFAISELLRYLTKLNQKLIQTIYRVLNRLQISFWFTKLKSYRYKQWSTVIQMKLNFWSKMDIFFKEIFWFTKLKNKIPYPNSYEPFEDFESQLFFLLKFV